MNSRTLFKKRSTILLLMFCLIFGLVFAPTTFAELDKVIVDDYDIPPGYYAGDESGDEELEKVIVDDYDEEDEEVVEEPQPEPEPEPEPEPTENLFAAYGVEVLGYEIGERGGYRLNTTNEPLGERLDFVIETRYYDSGGELVDTTEENHWIEAHWTNAYHWENTDWSQREVRDPGTYTVKAFIEGQEIATGTFVIEGTKEVTTEDRKATVTFEEARVTIDLETADDVAGTVDVKRFTATERAVPEELTPVGVFLTIERTEPLAGAKATIKVDLPDPLPEGVEKDELALFRYNEGTGQWDQLPSEVVGDQLWAEVEDFSLFGLFGTVAAADPAPMPAPAPVPTPEPAPEPAPAPEPVTETDPDPAPTGDLPQTDGGSAFSYRMFFAFLMITAGALVLTQRKRLEKE